MTIKENFINMLEILLINDNEIEMIENYEAEFCNNNKINDNSCIKNCRKCKHKYKEIVDLAVIDSYEGRHYLYNFKKSYNREITPIIYYQNMYNELAFLNKHIIGRKEKDDLKCYRKIDELRNYADEFFKELSEKYLPQINTDILPIRFYKFFKPLEEYGKKLIRVGIMRGEISKIS